jgi:glutamate/tyrosine decarboxylase-like PLP-dependent enzyme
VNTGAFDPIRAIADRCASHPSGAWLHVDGAFGLYAALAPSHAHLLDGVELADSVATDGHKWLNVPYDCGIVFVRERRYLREAFGGTAAYLATAADEEVWNAWEHVPDISRRFRALAVWCSLRALGRSGYQRIVERGIANAQRFAAWVTTQPNLELLGPAHLNIVCFRVIDPEREDVDADDLTSRALEQLQRGGVAYASGTRWAGHGAIRAAFDNWATGDDDVAALERAMASATAATIAAGSGHVGS